MPTVALVGTLDTKGREFAFVRSIFARHGVTTLTIHIGTFEPGFQPDISNADVVKAGGSDLAAPHSLMHCARISPTP